MPCVNDWNEIWFSRPGEQSTFTAIEGRAHECSTSFEVRFRRTSVFDGRSGRLSTSNRRSSPG